MWRRDSAAPLPARKCCSPQHIKWLPLVGGCVGRQCNRADLIRAAAGGPASEPATVLLAAPGLAENAAEVAGNPALVRAASGGRQRRACAPRGCRAHRGPQRCSWPVARCRDREQGRMPRSRQYTSSAHLACMCRGLSPQTIKLLYCGAASPCSFPSRLDTNGVRCELESFTRSPDPSFSSSARELAATRRTFGAQKRAITASHRLSP